MPARRPVTAPSPSTSLTATFHRTSIFGLRNPFYYLPYWGFFLEMLPYLFTVFVLVVGSREALLKRLGAPTALGVPYVRGERGL